MKAYKRIDSAVIHGGIYGDEKTGAVNTPIYQTSTFEQDGIGKTRNGWEYSRSGNPTRAALEALIAELEGGTAGFALASGLAAITTVLSMFNVGDKLVLSSDIYGGTYRLIDKVFKRLGLEYELIDTTDVSNIEKALTENVRALFIESPTNPLLDITDIAAAARIAKQNDVLLIVDNTFMTPILQRPLELGADIVVHSATKYLGGHSDLIAGLVVVKDDHLAEHIAFLQNAEGAVLGPMDSFLLIRGIKTLGVRMDRHVSNAERIAEYLTKHDSVKKIYYPGLKTAKGYDINAEQAASGGAMISFELDDRHDVDRFFRSLRMIALAESLGGVESLVCHPATMTHASIPYEIRQQTGITNNLIRLSVGIENIEDLIDDLSRAISKSEV